MIVTSLLVFFALLMCKLKNFASSINTEHNYTWDLHVQPDSPV